MNDIISDMENNVKDFVNSLEEIKDDEVKTLLLVIFLSKCGMNEEQIIKWFNSLNKEND